MRWQRVTSSYSSVHKYGSSEYEIEKSKFISYIKPVETEDEAIEFINSIKELHKTASHNCYAYVIDDNLKRFSDDGEPSHTAGMPILSTLEARNLKKVCVVVTRYFGGVLLGKGGLVRAYTQGCVEAIEVGIEVEKLDHYEILIKLDYSNLGPVENYLIKEEIFVINKEYLENVGILVYILKDDYKAFEKDLLDLTSANIAIEKVSEKVLSVKNNKIII